MALAELKQALSAPDPLALIREGIPALGPWTTWTFQRQIWYLRRKARLTQKELSRRSGVTQARLSRIEKGADVKLSTLATIFAALGHDLLIVPGPLGGPREDRWRNENQPRRSKSRADGRLRLRATGAPTSRPREERRPGAA